VFFRLSILKKMLIPPLIAVILFALYIFNIYIKQIENEKQINLIHQVHFPVLNIANENIILLENIIRSFADSVEAKEKSWLKNSKEYEKNLLDNLNKLLEFNLDKQNIDDLKVSFLKYFNTTYKLSMHMIEDNSNWDEIEILTNEMRENLKELKAKFKNFQDLQKKKFDLTIYTTNEQASKLFYTGITVGLISLVLILTLTILLSISTKKSLKELLSSVKNIAEGNPDFSKRLKKNSNDELGELVEQFNIFTNKLQKDYEELSLAKQDSESANKIKSEFIANMSHEIRTPLNAIIGFSELLNKTDVSSKQKNYLESITLGGNTLLSIINDILDISKIEAGKIEIQYEEVSLVSIINDIKTMFEQKIKEKDLSLVINMDETLPEAIKIDEIRLRQILFNIVGNALKFTHKGFIEINIKSLKQYENKINLQIDIKDTGIGIPKEQQTKIFESFVQQEGQSTRQYGGTGLGLAICLKLIKMMNGDIKLQSEENKGSTFSIILNDLEVSNKFNNQKNISLDEEVEFQKSSILIVDDIEVNRKLISAALENKNIIIYEAINGQEAVDFIKSTKPDLIFMDIKMPVMDGIEATKIIKQKDSSTNIVALTTSIRIKEMGETISLFDGYMTKPINYELLIKEMKRFLPHKNIQIKKVKENTLNSLSLDKRNINIFRRDFKYKIKNSWVKASQGCSFEDILEFSNTLNTFAIENEQTSIQEYTKSLNHAIDDFDINTIENLIEDFSIFLKETDND